MTEKFEKTNPLARGNKNIRPLEVYAEHTEIRKQIYYEIKKLYVTFLSAPSTFLTIKRFLDCLSPLKNLHDPGRLPFYTTVPKSTGRGRVSCVWAVVSCLVQAYWKYELDDIGNNELAVRVLLGRLKKINKHYPEMKITGAENRGYQLELD